MTTTNSTCNHVARSVLVFAVMSLCLLYTVSSTSAAAAEPCGDLSQCGVLIEINASDGDIGIHWLADAEGQYAMAIRDPRGATIWQDYADGALRKQMKTEIFGESEEPRCFHTKQDNNDLKTRIVTLRDFRKRWPPGHHEFVAYGEDGTLMKGSAELTYWLPAAPKDVRFDGSIVSWKPGNDLGKCAPHEEETLQELVESSVLAVLPEDVPVIAYQVVVEPEAVPGDPIGAQIFSVRVGVDTNQVTVPADYLASMPENTEIKIEVGAIGGSFYIEDGRIKGDYDNATFTEQGGFCINGSACNQDDADEDEQTRTAAVSERTARL